MKPNRKEFKVYCDTDYEKSGNKVIDGKSYNVYIEAQLINDEWIYDWFNYNVIMIYHLFIVQVIYFHPYQSRVSLLFFIYI
jgi:hypothetical protein